MRAVASGVSFAHLSNTTGSEDGRADPISRLKERIVSFCKSNQYELIWFCHDIEEVLIGHSVPDSEKLVFAKRFANMELYKKIDERKLTKAAYHKGYSNIKTVLDKFLSRRKLGDSDPQ